MSVSKQQLAVIAEQIGRQPKGLVKIAVATPQGVPLVLQMRSLVDDVPFPTLYWLSSKDLCKAIGQIEGQGWVKEVEARLQTDTDLRDAYLENQKTYVAHRWELMLPEDKQRIEALGFKQLFERNAIGGLSKWDQVRCLHMQYAHHLAEGNVIGALLDKEFELNKRCYSQ